MHLQAKFCRQCCGSQCGITHFADNVHVMHFMNFSALLASPFTARLRAGLAAAALVLLAACTTPITAKVTNFNAWPADAAGATFSFLAKSDTLGELEQSTYERFVSAELEGEGLRPAAAGQAGRFLVEVTAAGSQRKQKYREPVYVNPPLVWYPPYRSYRGVVYPGYWGPDYYGPRYVGDRIVTRTLQISRLQVKIVEIAAGPPGPARTVFDSTAVYEGDIGDLPNLVPYLVRAAFEDFPGKNGEVRLLRFDPKTGEIVRS